MGMSYHHMTNLSHYVIHFTRQNVGTLKTNIAEDGGMTIDNRAKRMIGMSLLIARLLL
jgi:hypothetical protein